MDFEPPLPRSFTRADHGRIGYGAFSILSIILSPGKSFTLAYYERWAYGVPSNLSNNHSRDSILDHFSVATVWGNSRALSLSIIGRNQTRILFVLGFTRRLFWVFFTAYLSRLKLYVPYTVIRAHSAMSCTFALYSDYLRDFNSFYFAGERALCKRSVGEFYSRTAQLKLREENNEEACCAH